MTKSPVQQFLDAGAHFTEMSRKQAETLVRNLVKSGEVRRNEAEKLVQSLLDRGRETSERIAAAVREDVERQVEIFTSRIEEIEQRIDELTRQLTGAPAKKAPAKKKAAAKKAPAKKKAAAKKAPAKKAAAKKTPRKKAARKTAPAAKAAKVTTSQQAEAGSSLSREYRQRELPGGRRSPRRERAAPR